MIKKVFSTYIIKDIDTKEIYCEAKSDTLLAHFCDECGKFIDIIKNETNIPDKIIFCKECQSLFSQEDFNKLDNDEYFSNNIEEED